MYRNDMKTSVEAMLCTIKLTTCRRYTQGSKWVIAICLTIPSKVHVEPILLIKAIANPRMTTSSFRITRYVEWETIAKLFLYNLDKVVNALICSGYHWGIIVEVIAQSTLGHIALRATCPIRVLHIGCNTHIIHQQSHSIFLLCSNVPTVIIRQHIVPVVVWLCKIGWANSVIKLHRIALLSLSLCWPFMVIHHLCNRSSHTPRYILGQLAVGIVLSPLAF